MNEFDLRIAGAAVGLAKTARYDEHTGELMALLTRALTCENSTAAGCARCEDEARAVKAFFAPNCADCAHPCERTAPYDFAGLDRLDARTKAAKLALLEAVRALARRTGCGWDDAGEKLLFDALCMIGEDWSAEAMAELTQRIAARI